MGNSQDNLEKTVKKTPITPNSPQQEVSKKKSHKFLFFGIGGILAVAGVVVVALVVNKKPEVIEIPYEQTGKYQYDTLATYLNEYNLDGVENLIEDSYISMEEEYINGIEIREDFLKKVFSYVDFSYDKIELKDVTGRPVLDDNGNVIMVEDNVTNGVSKITMSHIDWAEVQELVRKDSQAIISLYKEKKLSYLDYDYSNEIVDLFAEYILGKDELPLRHSVIKADLRGTAGSYTGINSDENLDDLLFSPADFYDLCDYFAEMVYRNDYDEVVSLAENEYNKQEDKTIPFETPLDMFADKEIIPYNWVGAYYNMKCADSVPVQPILGDGTFEKPAGIGTPIITKALCDDGLFHNVKVTLKGYWTGENAVNYAISFSEKNRGFDSKGLVKLICYEIEIENLEGVPITLNSDMYLSDNSANQTSRAGSVFGFYSEGTIEPYSSAVFNDWATSTDLEYKYVCWGKSFNRVYPSVCFRLLAGSGEEVPEYDANKSFINRDILE